MPSMFKFQLRSLVANLFCTASHRTKLLLGLDLLLQINAHVWLCLPHRLKDSKDLLPSLMHIKPYALRLLPLSLAMMRSRGLWLAFCLAGQGRYGVFSCVSLLLIGIFQLVSLNYVWHTPLSVVADFAGWCKAKRWHQCPAIGGPFYRQITGAFLCNVHSLILCLMAVSCFIQRLVASKANCSSFYQKINK